MKWYICDPRKNQHCTKTGCLYYMSGECFSTGDAACAMTGKDGPISYEEYEYEHVKEYMRQTCTCGFMHMIDELVLHGRAKG